MLETELPRSRTPRGSASCKYADAMPDVPSPVSIEAEAPPGQLLAVREAFEQHGFAVEVVANYERNSAGELPWVVLVAVLSFNGFLKGLGETAGKDANEALKDWVLDVFAARQ